MPIYSERLWPSPWLFISGLLFIPAVMIVFSPISISLAIPVSIGVFAAYIGFLVATTARITVTESSLQAGRAQIERKFIGEVEIAEYSRMRKLISTESDARAFLVIRSWMQRAVVVYVNDQADPTPYWLISTRRPEQLRDALSRAVTS